MNGNLLLLAVIQFVYGGFMLHRIPGLGFAFLLMACLCLGAALKYETEAARRPFLIYLALLGTVVLNVYLQVRMMMTNHSADIVLLAVCILVLAASGLTAWNTWAVGRSQSG